MTESKPPNQIDVSHLAHLARLRIQGPDVAVAQEDLAQIIRMIDVMQNVDTDGVEPMAHPHDAEARLREDRITEAVDPQLFQQSAPATQDGYYLVPRVVE